MSVSPDGRYVATSGAPGQVKLWDTSTFREVGPDLPSPQGAATARARFAPDGSLVVAYSPDNAALDMKAPLDGTSGGDLRHGAAVWQYPVGRAAWERLACSLVGRPLTPGGVGHLPPGDGVPADLRLTAPGHDRRTGRR